MALRQHQTTRLFTSLLPETNRMDCARANGCFQGPLVPERHPRMILGPVKPVIPFLPPSPALLPPDPDLGLFTVLIFVHDGNAPWTA